MTIKLICVDADDTLWHNERHFGAAQDIFLNLLGPFAASAESRAALSAAAIRNLQIYGYGAKSFTLSMIETAIEVGGTQLPVSVIGELLSAGRHLHSHPVEVFEGVEQALDDLAKRAPLVLATKGDLLHQEIKLAGSGLDKKFSGVEIVSDKKAHVFERIFARYEVMPEEAIVIGDSMRSDILPALEAGAWAAHIPHPLAWVHESASPPADHPRLRQFESLDAVSVWIDLLES
jgi:putative hydrolase of the HAD superfamily